ncbi:MAG: nucleotide exchange factor GrpE [Sedimentisphaerales bacterium]|nr:nucleotide exchange factor GrpE [Sedimentisphaerales bacterium]
MKKSKKDKSKAEEPHQADHEETVKKGEVDELRSTMESLQKEKDELFGKLQRVSADYANYQKRVPKQINDTISYEKERIIKSLLPALDNFEHTLQNAHSAEKVEVLVKGIQIIYDQFIEILKSHNVEQIKALGEPFDPSVHEAMTQQTDIEKGPNVVLEEFQTGYTLNGRVIRPSKVIVNKLPIEPTGREEAASEEPTTDECETVEEE